MSSSKATIREQHRAALDFLEGRGPNPIPASKRQRPEGAVKQFMDETLEEIAQQDREIDLKEEPNMVDDFIAAMRLISDNHELIQLVQSKACNTVSELAKAMGRELPNVSRTLSRMAAYGLIGFEEAEGDARAKKPIWLLSTLSNHKDMDWVQAYCIAMALQAESAARPGGVNVSQMEDAVREVVASTAKRIHVKAVHAAHR
jgi:predicted transcriptional regulator